VIVSAVASPPDFGRRGRAGIGAPRWRLSEVLGTVPRAFPQGQDDGQVV